MAALSSPTRGCDRGRFKCSWRMGCPTGYRFAASHPIRTHETVARLPVFKTGAFNHSATHPATKINAGNVGIVQATQERRKPSVALAKGPAI